MSIQNDNNTLVMCNLMAKGYGHDVVRAIWRVGTVEMFKLDENGSEAMIESEDELDAMIQSDNVWIEFFGSNVRKFTQLNETEEWAEVSL